MSIVLVTGSHGLIGSQAVRFYAKQGKTVVGIDNDMRASFFGPEASTRWQLDALSRSLSAVNLNYVYRDADIRDRDAMEKIFSEYGSAIDLIIHTAAQPSHDWAAQDPHTDFTVNANGTLTLLECCRRHCPKAVFIFTSTNKVYGDRPNFLPLIETETRYEIEPGHVYEGGIDESMSIDQTMHSLFGASKVAADVLVQEYGRYFGMKTACFRSGCLTGPAHSGAPQHGFLSYLMKCVATGQPYTVFGYRGKQVRDNIHSADLVAAFDEFYRAPRPGEVYNIGGGRFSNCSMLEAIEMSEAIADKKLSWTYAEQNRQGDHIWWVSSMAKFRQHYPNWKQTYGIESILGEIFEATVERSPVRSTA